MSQLERTFKMLIDGELVTSPAQSNKYTVFDPSYGRPLASITAAEESSTSRALHAARRAFDAGIWSRAQPKQRADALQKLADRIEEHQLELTELEILNVGKPAAQARADVVGVVETFRYYATLAEAVGGQVIENTEQQLTIVLREPVGVVAAIIPWNYPLAIAALSIAPALAAGCSVILKPSELTPLTALRLGELAIDLFPPGVLNVVSGGGVVGEALVSASEVDKVIFTGGTTTGRRVAALAARGPKRISLELGGKSPTIIFADAPVDAAAESALWRIALNQGENCGAGSRLLVHREIYKDIIDALIGKAERLKMGDPKDQDTDLGPMISHHHRLKVLGHMKDAERESRKLFVGELPRDPRLQGGFWVPLSIWETQPGCRLWREEVFGPTLSVIAFEDEAEAIRLANDSEYGLAATIWSAERGRALRVSRQIRAGVIRINSAAPPAYAPWGGFKASGYGRSQGRYGLESCMELKSITVDIGKIP